MGKQSCNCIYSPVILMPRINDSFICSCALIQEDHKMRSVCMITCLCVVPVNHCINLIKITYEFGIHLFLRKKYL